jgi:hypothetical protein
MIVIYHFIKFKIGFLVIRDVTYGDMHVVWYSPTEVYSFKPKSFINTKIMRSVTKKLGTYFQKCKYFKIILLDLNYKLLYNIDNSFFALI